MKITTLALALTLFTLPAAAQADPHDHMATKPPQTGDAMPAKPPVPASKSLNVTFEGRTITLTVEDLLNMPQVTVHVHNAHSQKDETYTGPLVSEVLAKAGLVSNRETQPLILHSSLVATGTDHYFVLYSLAEVEPAFSTGQSIVAVMRNGLPDEPGGVIQIINTADAKPARWVHGLANLNVMSLSQNK